MNGCQESPMSGDAPIAKATISTVKEKRCPKCGEIKPLETFGTDKRTTDNCRVWCKTCERTYNHIWRKANPEYGRIRAKASPQKNRDRQNKLSWSKANSEKRCESARRWRERNPEKCLDVARRAGVKRRNTPRGTLNNRMAVAMNLSLKCGKQGHRWESLVGYTVNNLKEHLENLFRKGMNWERLMKGEIHIDHIIPKSAFNYEKPEDEDFKRCWALKNLQPLWAKDNLVKNAKINKHFQPSLIF